MAGPVGFGICAGAGKLAKELRRGRVFGLSFFLGLFLGGRVTVVILRRLRLLPVAFSPIFYSFVAFLEVGYP